MVVVHERRRTASLVSSLMNDKDVKAAMKSLFAEEIKAALEKQKNALTAQLRTEIQASVNDEVEVRRLSVNRVFPFCRAILYLVVLLLRSLSFACRHGRHA